jgi:uncharacterized protein (PEP-CTERM system associated)
MSFASNHRTRSTNWTARYYEEVSDIPQQLSEASGKLFSVCTDDEGIPTYLLAFDEAPQILSSNCSMPSTSADLIDKYNLSDKAAVELDLVNTSIAKGVYIIKSFTAGVSWNIKRLNFGLSVQDTRRLYQVLSDAQDHIQGVIGSVSYRLSPQTTARSSLSLSRNSIDSLVVGGVTREDDVLSLDVGLNHRFAEDLSGTLTFRHSQRDSNVATGDYEENRVSAAVNMRF